jgi:hypothetical protein
VAARYFVRALQAERQLGIAEPNFLLAQKWRSLMARYFFRADYRGITVNDDVGEEFSTLRDAEAHAAIVASELVRNRSQAVTVSVLSQDGTLLAKAAAPSDRFSSRRVSRVESGLSPGSPKHGDSRAAAREAIRRHRGLPPWREDEVRLSSGAIWSGSARTQEE